MKQFKYIYSMNNHTPTIRMVLVSMTLTIASAQIASEDIVQRNTGVLHYSVVEPSEQLVAQNATVWDFSQLRIIQPDYRIEIETSDSTIYELANRCRTSYRLQNDTLFWRGKESHLSCLSDSIPAIALTYPLYVGSNGSKPYSFKGIYSSNSLIEEKGLSRFVVEGIGTMILPFDTIQEVLKVHRQYEGQINMFIGGVVDSTNIANSTMHKLDIYEWVKEGRLFPLAKLTVEHFMLDSLSIQSEEQCLVYVSGGEEVLSPPMTKAKHIASAPSYYDENEESSVAEHLRQPKVSISSDQNKLSLHFVEERNCTITVKVCDSLGRISITKDFCGFAASELSLDISELPSGHYVAYILINNRLTASYKFSKIK